MISHLPSIVPLSSKIKQISASLQCKDMIESNGETIIALILRLKSRREICEALLMCSGKAATVRTKRQLLGESKCSRGPGYWCESIENANECGNSVSYDCN